MRELQLPAAQPIAEIGEQFASLVGEADEYNAVIGGRASPVDQVARLQLFEHSRRGGHADGCRGGEVADGDAVVLEKRREERDLRCGQVMAELACRHREWASASQRRQRGVEPSAEADQKGDTNSPTSQ